MKILAVDTATHSCSVAITAQSSLLAEITRVSRETHSRHLLNMIEEVLAIAGVSLEAVDGFAVTRGPGSFTGLRIGLSVVKGMALARQKPVVGVSSLEALAFPFFMTPHLICTMMDARKSEVYVAGYRYRSDENGLPVLICDIPEQVLPPEKALAYFNEPCFFVGTGSAVYHADITCHFQKTGQTARFAPSSMNLVRAASVAQLSLNRFKDNQDDNIAALKPRYIRRSDAELKSAPSTSA